eukprot:scaffold237891_cov28-Prasinocladus_malaysianus.AAC.1
MENFRQSGELFCVTHLTSTRTSTVFDTCRVRYTNELSRSGTLAGTRTDMCYVLRGASSTPSTLNRFKVQSSKLIQRALDPARSAVTCAPDQQDTGLLSNFAGLPQAF